MGWRREKKWRSFCSSFLAGARVDVDRVPRTVRFALKFAMARRRYLKKTPLREALDLFLAGVDPLQLATEAIPVTAARERVTAEPVFAKISSPHYHAAAMDGIGNVNVRIKENLHDAFVP